MRGWWSTRSRAKIWDGGAARTFAPRPSEPIPVPEVELIAEPSAPPEPPEPVAPPEPTVAAAPLAHAAPETQPLAALFDPRPDDFPPRDTTATEPPAAPPLEVTIAESPYYERTTLGGPDSLLTTIPTAAPSLDSQGEFLRLLEVVTSMCDHVIGYIEADRAERRQMMEMLTQLGRVITEGSAAAVAAFTALSNASVNANPARPLDPAAETFVPAPVPVSVPVPATDPQPRERVIGGSMPAGPEPHVDLVGAERNPDDPALATLASAKIHIAVEVRGKFGDRWVDGFEICEVMTTPSGTRYKLRRQRDGVVLPELFDATNIRHIETPDEAKDEANDEAAGVASAGDPQTSRERSMGSHPSGTNGDSAPVNGSGYWSRS
jgi:hypothetical protein